MSSFQRRHVSPEEFSSLVQDYYQKKESYDVAFLKDLEQHIDMSAKKPEAEHAAGDITDQVAKDSSDSTASTHPVHDVHTGAKEGKKASATDHQSTPGPVIASNIGEPASKEELKKRSEELNK